MKIKVNYQNSICINDDIYIDPLKVEENNNAKYIFITHAHWDHFSIEDIKKILTKDTIIICPKSMEQDVKFNFANNLFGVEPNKSYILKDIKFETFNSYNISKKYHPKENNWVGYTLNVENKRITIIGDSDLTEELKTIKTDVLLVPIGGHYTMDLYEAAELTNLIKPKKVIPTHYGEVVGNREMGKEFKCLIDKSIECELQI